MDKAHELAEEALQKGDALGWFEQLYKSAGGDPSAIPWAKLRASPSLVDWLDRHPVKGRALVIGCGLGDDAEELARRGLGVTAFDISPTAIEWCKKRFPRSPVEYLIVDLFRAPASFDGAFDFVFEASTLQSLPVEPRRRAVDCLERFLSPSGRLLIITRGRNPSEDPGRLPWPLTRVELDRFKQLGLEQVAFEDYVDSGIRRFRAEYRRPAP